ncbi:unnamed protein product, partial [Ectocarpus sp. 12 AP-2014]
IALLAVLLSTHMANAQVWDGSTSSDFTVGTNWVGDVPPNSSASVQLNGDGGNAPILGTSYEIGSFLGTAGTLTIDGATLTVNSLFTLSGTSALQLNNGATVAGPNWFTWNNGSITGLGTINFDTIDINSGSNETIPVGITLNGSVFSSREVAIQGTITGQIAVESGGVLDFQSTGSTTAPNVSIQSGGTIRTDGGAFGFNSAFDNAGFLDINGDESTASLLNRSFGTTAIQAGSTLTLNSGSSSNDGTISEAGTLAIAGGNFNQNSGTIGTSVQVSDGVFTHAGGTTTSSVTVTGG